ncbi:MAG: 1-acyl-sn-glycerol-3-phosphate acyltransferase, partial [Acetobacteraceae bacterium]|nr:1-acyl-sn-glycerol-3-phosphate acyltransferase [Acetobacteraceae bacterium]
QAAWRSGVRAWLRLYHRLRIEGRENLPPAPPFILVANHSSHLDALSLGAALRGAAAGRAYALAAGDHFFAGSASAAFAAGAINALPVWRGQPARAAGDIGVLRERLVEDGGSVFILFPEGTRSRTGAMGSFQAGIGALISGTGVPVVPCHLAGAFAAWPPTARWPRPGKLVLRIGMPLVFGEGYRGKAGWTRIAAECEAAVRAVGAASDAPPLITRRGLRSAPP